MGAEMMDNTYAQREAASALVAESIQTAQEHPTRRQAALDHSFSE